MNNPRKIIMDTSAWIISFKKNTDKKILDHIKKLLTRGQIVTSQLIILELLQGCKSFDEKARLQLQLESLDIIDIHDNVWEQAYQLSFFLRRKGLTIPTFDVLIASLAIYYNFELLHYDRHYDLISKHSVNFKQLNLNELKSNLNY